MSVKSRSATVTRSCVLSRSDEVERTCLGKIGFEVRRGSVALSLLFLKPCKTIQFLSPQNVHCKQDAKILRSQNSPQTLSIPDFRGADIIQLGKSRHCFYQKYVQGRKKFHVCRLQQEPQNLTRLNKERDDLHVMRLWKHV